MLLGGIIGRIGSSTCNISNCSNSGNVTAQDYNAGGIVGIIDNNSIVTIDKVYNTASITTNKNNDVGGIVGKVNNNSVVNVREAYNTGSICAKVYSAGGIVGCSYGSAKTTIENCFNIGNISGNDCYGGILGDIDNSASGIIHYCHNYGTISGTAASRGGIIGYQNGTYMGTANYWLLTCGATYGIGKTNTYNNAKQYTAEQMKKQLNFEGWDFENTWKMDTTKGYPILKNVPDVIGEKVK